MKNCDKLDILNRLPVFEPEPLQKKGKTIEEHVQDAERLAKEHGGILPNPYWLVKNGRSGLNACMKKHPEAFAHIIQDRKFKTVEEHVQDAERLAKKHNGILPCCAWLQRNGHAGLRACMKKHPKAFAHIPQDRKFKTIEEHVQDAKKLAKQHGILPNSKWLQRNGHAGLRACMKNHSKAFAHISQDSKRKTIEEHVQDAEKLAKKHNGILPNPEWLRKNRYYGFYACMRKNPKAFAHIPRMVRDKVVLGKNVK